MGFNLGFKGLMAKYRSLCCPGVRVVAGLSAVATAQDGAQRMDIVKRSVSCTRQYATSCWPLTVATWHLCTWSWCHCDVYCYSLTLTSGALCWQWSHITKSAGSCLPSGETTRKMLSTGSERNGAWSNMKRISSTPYAVFWRCDILANYLIFLIH